MREKLKALADLQKVDLEIAALKKANDVHPRQLAELEKELAGARSALEAERNRVADVERQKRTLEQNIQDEKDKVKKWEARLAEQRSTREYSALAREIDIAKKANITQAEELIELGKSLANAREQLAAKETEFTARHDEIQQKIGALREQIASAGEGVKALEGKREDFAKEVDSTLLRRYDVIKKKRLPALAGVVAGACTGCKMKIPPQLYNQLMTVIDTDVCPSCNRIIYAADSVGPAAAAK